MNPASALSPRQMLQAQGCMNPEMPSEKHSRLKKMSLGCRERLWSPHKPRRKNGHSAVEASRSYVNAVTARTTY